MEKLKWKDVIDQSLPIDCVVMLREILESNKNKYILFMGLTPIPIDLKIKEDEDKYIRGKIIFIPDKEVNDSQHSGWLLEDILVNNVWQKVLFKR